MGVLKTLEEKYKYVWLKDAAKKLRSSSTPAENRLRFFLKRNHIKYYFQKPMHLGSYFCIPDFVLKNKKHMPKKKIVIEVDGGYHTTPEQMAKDEKRDKLFKSYGYRVIRIKNEDTANDDYLSELLKEFLPSLA